MANFCRFCGKPLNNGNCDCPQAMEAERRAKEQVLAAMQAAATGAVQPGPAMAGGQPASGPAMAGGQPASGPAMAEGQPASGPAMAGGQQPSQSAGLEQIGKDMKDLFLGFWKAPVLTLQQAAMKREKTPQLLMTAVYAVIMLIAICLMGKNDLIGGDQIFKMAFVLMITSVIIRGIYASGVYLAAKKSNPSLDYLSVIGVFSVTFILDMAIILLVMLSAVLALYELMIAFMLFWLIATVAAAFLATWVVTGQRMELTYRITLVLQVIVMIILVFAIRSAATRMISSMARSMMGGFGF